MTWLTILLLSASPCGTATQCYEKALPLYERGAANALPLLESACDQGHDVSCCLLGDDRYRRGLRADTGKRCETACEAGTGEACRVLGRLLQSGTPGSGGERERAAGAFKRGCSLGAPAACNDLAVMMMSGETSLGTANTGRTLLAKACRDGFAPACANLGGDAMERKAYREAKSHFALGCAGGEDVACLGLGYLYEEGLLGKVAMANALSHYQSACRDGVGHQEACFREARIIVEGQTASKDPTRARRLAEGACRAGERAKACSLYGFLLMEGVGGPRDESQARRVLKLACDGDDSQACRNLGLLFLQARGGAKDRRAGLAAVRRACAQRLSTACDDLRRWKEPLRSPDGPPCTSAGACWDRAVPLLNREDPRALSYLLSACDLGSVDGCCALAAAPYRASMPKDAPIHCEARCQAGQSNACLVLGALHEDGHATGVNLGRAATLYEKACQLRSDVGCNRLGLVLTRPAAAKSARDRGLRALSGACRRGYGIACFNLGQRLFDADRAEDAVKAVESGCALGHAASCERAGRHHQAHAVDDDGLRTALRYYGQGCSVGGSTPSACFQRGLMRLKGLGGPADPAEARAMFELACRTGKHPRACGLFGHTLTLKSAGPTDATLAREMLKLACDENVANACALYGALLLQGHGGAKDTEQGLHWVRRGCALGDSGSCRQLRVWKQPLQVSGGLCTTAESCWNKAQPLLGIDAPEALPYVESACDQGADAACCVLTTAPYRSASRADSPRRCERACKADDGAACVNLGLLHETGAIVGIRDLGKAAVSYQRGCKLGDEHGCSNLANLMLDGKTTLGSPKEGARLLDKACSKKSAAACFNLGERASGEQRYREAATLHRKACDLGYPDACWRLGSLHENGQGVKANMAAALTHYQRACDSGLRSHRGCLAAGRLLLRGAPAPDPTRARALFARACGSGESPRACGLYGMMLNRADAGRPNPTLARTHLKGACNAGIGDACARYGAMLSRGQGGQKDPTEAEWWMRRACALGNQAACGQLRPQGQ